MRARRIGFTLGAVLAAATTPATAQGWLEDPVTGCAVWSDETDERVASWSGVCVDDKASGIGVLVVMSEGELDVRYDGPMEAGKARGLGLVAYRTDSGFAHYAGQFENSTLHGRGFTELPSGARYEGEFVRDVPHGAGTYTAADGARYQGEFERGEPHGNGYDIRPDGETYYGQYADGQREGLGWVRYPNGDHFFGEFQDGEPHGQGVYTLASGDRFRGQIVDNAPNGEIVVTRTDGTQERQVWKNGEQVR